jgi:hypothetical protein
VLWDVVKTKSWEKSLQEMGIQARDGSHRTCFEKDF